MEEKFPYQLIKREVLMREDAPTDPKSGCEPAKRSIAQLLNTGIVYIDKPSGPTSHQISGYVKEILDVPKAGHSGTLDPKVTGVLPVTVGGATKGVQLLIKAGKEYVAIMHLHKEIEEVELRKAFEEFLGKIEQLPPIRSSVKRQLRTRSVYYYNILEISGNDVMFKVGCEAGTYIRKLIHDIGKRLGCGAHMVDLRRTRVGPIGEEHLVTLQDLKDAVHYYKTEQNDKYLRYCIKPLEVAIDHIPKIWAHDTAVDSVCHGAQLNIPGICKLESGIEKDDIVAVLTLKGERVCYGFAMADTKTMMGERGSAVKTEKVFMEPGTYPKIPVPQKAE
jgi:H/ACA ribonucleoprotein complex subunit 4